MPLVDGYFDLPTKVRKDPLGPGYLNTVIANEEFLTRWFGAEHLLGTGTGAQGEHNAAEIPRSAAVLTATGGPPATSYSVNCQDGYLSLASTPNPGDLRLALDNACGATFGKMVVQTQCLSSAFQVSGGIDYYLPGFNYVDIISATDIRVYTVQITYLGSPHSSTELWNVGRTNLALAVYSEPIVDTDFTNGLAAAPVRNQSLRNAALWNKLVQRDGDLRQAFTFAHTAAGAHNDFRVPWGSEHITWDGAAYAAVAAESDGPGIDSITRAGVGRLKVFLNTSYGGSAFAPFINVDYARSDGGSASDILIATCPLSLFDGDAFEVRIFKYNLNTGPYWEPADADFFLTLHSV